MSLTNGHDIYVALADTGFQKFINGVFAARPHYFQYATAPISNESIDITTVPPLFIPGAITPLNYSISLSSPEIVFNPDALKAALPAGQAWVGGYNQNDFEIYLAVSFILYEAVIPLKQLSGTLKIWNLGQVKAATTGGVTSISLSISESIVDGADQLNGLFAYALTLTLNSLLQRLAIPLASLSFGAFAFSLDALPPPATNPAIANGQLTLLGALT